MSLPSDDITLSGVLSETNRILEANRNHFLILSLLFLLPLYLLLIIYITIFPVGPHSNSTFTASPTILQILYITVCCVFFISATGTITYSAFHGYYNRPLELIPTFKSLSSSFIPLCSTLIFFLLIYTSTGFLIGIVGGVMYMWLESFICTIIVVVPIVLVCATYFRGNWVISNVIVVVESKWGYEPLRRSAYLMKGMRRVTLKSIVSGALSYLFIYTYCLNSSRLDTLGFWQWIFKMVAGSCWITVLMEYNLTAYVVLYIYCMKKHGEFCMEIQPEESASLLINDGGTGNTPVASVVDA